MRLETSFPHQECPYYSTESSVGFKCVSLKANKHYTNTLHACNRLIFLLEGEIEFSYNEYIGKRFTKGDMIFIPQASEMHGVAISDVEMLVHTYDLARQSYCSNCQLSRGKFDVIGLHEVNYDFQPLRMTPEVEQFAQLIKTYIQSDYRCLYMHELKQKELFILMEFAYTRRERMEFFYPILGEDIHFRNRMLSIAHEQLTVEEYARRFNMGTRTFARKFKMEFGQTTQEWLLQHKRAQIKLRLSLPHVDISEIIQEFKFPDPRHFYRFCRVHFGCTSRELTMQLRGKSAHL